MSKEKLSSRVSFLSDVLFVFSFFRRYVWLIVLAIPFSFAFSSSRGVLALLAKEGVDRGLVEGNKYVLLKFSLSVVGLYLLAGVSRVISSYLVNLAVQSMIRDVREKIFSKITSVSLDKNVSSSSAVSRLLGDVEAVGGFPDIIRSILREPISLVFLTGVLVYMNWKLALFSLSAFVLVVFPANYIGKKVRKASARIREAADKISEKIIEAIQGAKVVRVYSADVMNLAFRRSLEVFKNYSIKSRVLPELTSSIAEISGAIIVGAVVMFSAMEIAAGRMTTGEFFAFVGATVGLWEPIKNLIRIPSEVGRIIPPARRIHEFQKIPSIRSGSIKKESFERSIVFERVSVGFDGKLILRDVDLEVRKGDRISVIGRSGVGKTTLVSLIPRFFDPVGGRILMDGVDIRDIDVESLRRIIAFVEQEPFIFDDTIYENVRIARPKARDQEVREALERAGLDLGSFDRNFRCGEGGRNLSQGQRQRIAIARAFLKNPQIVIMDEPTASVDPELEDALLRTFEDLMEGKTVIVVSHKPKTAMWSRRFFMVENGKVYEVDREIMMAFFTSFASLT